MMTLLRRGSTRSRFHPLLAGLGLLALAACGGAPARHRVSMGDGAQSVVRPPTEAVRRYRTASATGPVVIGETGVAAAVEESVVAAGRERGEALRGDSRLAHLSAWVAEQLGPDGEPPSSETIDFLCRHLGLVEPVPHVVVLGQTASELTSAVSASVRQFLERQSYNRFGGSVVSRGGLQIVVLMLSWRWLDLSPVPRELAVGDALTLRGQLLRGHRNPVVVVAEPSGNVRRVPAGSGPGFVVQVPLPSQGVYRVEVVGQGSMGNTVIANFPVYAGLRAPRTFRRSPEPPAPAPLDASSVQQALFSMVQATRREAGLPELEPHAALSEVALAHSQDMADHDFVAHVSAQSGSPAERVRASGIRTGLVLENIGRGYSAGQIHRGLLASPGHRANLLNPDVTHLGVGVIGQPDGPTHAFLVTELFIRLRGPADLSRAGERLIARLNAARSARGAPPLRLEEHLSEAAQRAADLYFAETAATQEDAMDEANTRASRFHIAYRRLGSLMAVVQDVEDAGSLEPALNPDVRYIGIGAAQGNRSDAPENAIAVVMVLAWPR